MAECDRFLHDMEKVGLKTERITYGCDSVETRSIDTGTTMLAKCSISVRLLFDMKKINIIQKTLQKGKYDFTIAISGDIKQRRVEKGIGRTGFTKFEERSGKAGRRSWTNGKGSKIY